MRKLITLIAAIIAITSCSGGGDDGATQPSAPVEDIVLCYQSLKEGAEVEATDVTNITLQYSADVTVGTSAAITLNGEKVTAGNSTRSAMEISIPVTLAAGTSYTLSIPAGAIVNSKDATHIAPAFTLHFKTKTEAEPEPEPSAGTYDDLCDKSATAEAQKLYAYLKECYGQKMLSSVIANVNWNTTEADKIYTATGKYPAFNCYDFIHIYVPSGNGWINYSDITPVTNWTDKGGLVQLMWHFNVPKSEDTVVKTNGEGVTCTPSETTFHATNALKSGTWEYKWFYSEMDKVCDIMLKLQQKNIAAVWRPFHEAAGNATLKSGASWGTAWFWWGYSGAATYKKLWQAMYEYFQQKGIHNLIWVWTTQNNNGNSSQYNNDADWYPGDSYVDIIGRDLYGYTAAQNVTEFSEITKCYPKKMVTLSECGVNGSTAFSEVNAMWTAGARWLYFMPWYGASMTSDSWWKNAFNLSYVITRDKVKY